jgi:DNA modification methylase
MPVLDQVKRIKIQGHSHARTLSCPYCGKTQRVTLVRHLKRQHPDIWETWSDEFVRLFNETNDLKRVMRSFSNSEGTPILSWTSIDSELQRKVSIKGESLQFNRKQNISTWDPSAHEYSGFRTTVWDLPVRGTWSVHQPTYRGNWAPQVPRAIIEFYSKPGELVLDPFVGGGTTLIEAWLLGRHAVGVDVSANALAMTRSRLDELKTRARRESLYGLPEVQVEVRKGDARKLSRIREESVDLICTHPPYGNALSYTHKNPNDLSQIADPNAFIDALAIAGRRFYEVLKPGGFCAMLLGDIRQDNMLWPLGFTALNRFREIGFKLEDIIIKTQSKDRSTEFYFKVDHFRLRLAHEYLFVLRKTPAHGRMLQRCKVTGRQK